MLELSLLELANLTVVGCSYYCCGLVMKVVTLILMLESNLSELPLMKVVTLVVVGYDGVFLIHHAILHHSVNFFFYFSLLTFLSFLLLILMIFLFLFLIFLK